MAGDKRPKGVKKPHRYRPGTRALMEIRRYQKTTDSFVRLATLRRLLKERLQENHIASFQLSNAAVELVRQALEAYVVGVFEQANLHAIHAKRTTVRVTDIDHEIEKVRHM
jgi:histone H3